MKLQVQGGRGWDNVQLHRKGEYIVKTESGQKKFSFLADAKEYYNSLQEAKAFWAIKRNVPVLIESVN